jgi:PKD repeat protein
MKTVIKLTGILLFLMGFTSPESALSQKGFIENKGQWDERILFKASIPGGNMLLLRDGFMYNIREYEDAHPHSGHSFPTAKGHAIKVTFNNSSEKIDISGLEASSENYNFFLGKDKRFWARGVKSYRKVLLTTVYDGIDISVYTENGSPKYDIIVSPGADLSNLSFSIEGADEIRLKDNQLIMENSISDLYESIPQSYQPVASGRKYLDCRYKLNGNVVSFEVASRPDPDLPIVIDPILVFSTYSGSVSDNWGYTAAFDDLGNAYSGGIVFDTVFVATPGAYDEEFNGGSVDIGILKFNQDGSRLLWATYLGGNGSESPHSLVVDPRDRSLIILGTTSSTNYPVLSNAFSRQFSGGSPIPNIMETNSLNYQNGSDMVISKLSLSGDELLASTYLGGSDNDGLNIRSNPLTKNYGDQFRGDVITDENGFIYVASNTNSPDFPIKNAIQDTIGAPGLSDAVVFKMDPTLSRMEWGTFLGGSDHDAAYSIQLNGSGVSYIAGGTISQDFPLSSKAHRTTPENSDNGFVAAISPSGDALLGSTYVGSENDEIVYFVDLDPSGKVWVMGNSDGSSMPVSSGVYSNPGSGQFIQRFSPDLMQLEISTVIGSGVRSKDFSPTAFLINDCGNIYISGWGSSSGAFIPSSGNTIGLPVTNDAFQNNSDGSDFYLMVLENDARSLLYATFFGEVGGPSGDHVDGGTSRFDKRGIVYQAVCASCGGSNGFPTTENAFSRTNNSNNCNNAIFKFDLASLNARITTNTPDLNNPGIKIGCAPFEILFYNKSNGGETITWDFGDGNTSNERDSVIHVYDEPGEYLVTLEIRDPNTCKQVDIAQTTIQIFEPQFSVSSDQNICGGESAELVANGANMYLWKSTDFIEDSTSARIIVSPAETTDYIIEASDLKNCRFLDTVRVNVTPQVIADFEIKTSYRCRGKNAYQLKNLSQNAENFTWLLSNGIQFNNQDTVITFTEDTSQVIGTRLIGATNQCSDEKVLEIQDVPVQIPNVITPDLTDNLNDKFVIQSNTEPGLVITNRHGKTVYESNAYKNDWPFEDVTGGVYYYDVTFPDETHCKGWLHVIK